MKYTEENSLHQLEMSIDYIYRNKKNAIQAITHSSYAYEHRQDGLCSNERLEFLGDSVLNFIITTRLFNTSSEMPEGEMSKLRASVVSEVSLAMCAKKLKIGHVLLLGKGEEIMGGRERISILADAMEAVIGSLYLDGGLKAAEAFVEKYLHENLIKAINGKLVTDYKTMLQEEVQKKTDSQIQYSVIHEKGPDHNKTFTSAVSINGDMMGKGNGKTKKEAEQNAAKNALEKWIDNA